MQTCVLLQCGVVSLQKNYVSGRLSFAIWTHVCRQLCLGLFQTRDSDFFYHFHATIHVTVLVRLVTIGHRVGHVR